MRLFLILSISFFFVYGCHEKKSINFVEIDSPTKENSSLPRLYSDDSGVTFMSWIEENEDVAELKYATFDGDSWSDSYTIASDSTWFLNWADYPSIISENGLPLAAHWLDKKPGGTYSYDVKISTYSDSTWNSAFAPHEDNTSTEHGFVSMEPASDSTFLAVWLDGRKTAEREHDEYGDIDKAMTLRAALIHKNGTILQKYLLDDSVCDCCNTALTKTKNGFILAYRNRTHDEVRDIYYTSFTDGTWSKPMPIHADGWEIAACPVNGPAIDADSSIIATAWFTGADDTEKIKLAISKGFGEPFSEAITVGTDHALGRVDIAVNENKIWVLWMAAENETGTLELSTYSTSGEFLSKTSLTDISYQREAGFPEMEIINEQLIIAYTDIVGEEKMIRTIISE